jgi:hypothetical protein
MGTAPEITGSAAAGIELITMRDSLPAVGRVPTIVPHLLVSFGPT